MAKRKAATVIKEIKAVYAGINEAREQMAAKKSELETKLAEMNSELMAHKESAVLDFSDDALSKETELQRSIEDIKTAIHAIEDKAARMVFPESLSALSEEALQLTKQEAMARYASELPSLLSQINEAKRNYLGLLANYHELHAGVRKSIIDAGREAVRDVTNFDFPYPNVVHFNDYSDDYSQGSLYGISDREVYDATQYGKVNVNTK